jgi:predicted metal-dependent phosphoesterase TrpH
MLGTVVDMHVHTTMGASDSQLDPDDLAGVARNIGLTGVTITEHDRVWDRHSSSHFQGKHAHLFMFPAMEVSTELGHILAYGLPEYLPGIRRAVELRRALDAVGGYMVAAHPFRHWFDPVSFRRAGKEPPEMVPERMAELPIFGLVDAIEVLNGANTNRENRFALEVASLLGKPATGGSDAHSTSGIGIYTTIFEQALVGGEHLLAELHAGRFSAGLGLPDGELRTFTLDSFAAEPQPAD